MAIYIFIFIYIFALIFFFDLKSAHPNHSKKAKLHYHILEVIFILVVGLSYRVGSDTIGYMDGFPYYPTFVTFSFDNLSEYTREPLWVLLNITIRSTFNDFSFVMLFCAITINVVIFKLIKENSLYPFSTLLLYYLLGWINVSFEMLRQTCAVAFIIWGCLYLLKGDRKAFFIRSFPAIFFHISGIFVVLLLLAFSYIKINKVSLMACFSIFFIGILLKNSFGDVLNMINIISAGSGEVYAEYLDSENYGLLNRSFYGYVENFCLNLFLPGSVVVYYYRKGINHNFIRILLVFVVLSSLSSVLGIIHRMAAYLQFFYYIGIVNMLYDRFKSRKKVLEACFVALLLFYSINNSAGSLFWGRYERFSYNNHDVRYFPYTNVFTMETIPEREASCAGNFDVVR